MYDETLRPQTRLGDYLIKGVLGSGAFGITYLAEDRQQRCNVAIKEYYLRPLLRGLKDIHARWLLHRDIKPDNIYPREDGTPVLIDFGTARHVLALRGQGMTTYLTPGFAPPE